MNFDKLIDNEIDKMWKQEYICDFFTCSTEPEKSLTTQDLIDAYNKIDTLKLKIYFFDTMYVNKNLFEKCKMNLLINHIEYYIENNNHIIIDLPGHIIHIYYCKDLKLNDDGYYKINSNKFFQEYKNSLTFK